MNNTNFLVDVVCPHCHKAGRVYEQHRLVAKALVTGMDLKGVVAVRELNEKDAAEAEDEGWDDNETRFTCIECYTEFGQNRLVTASLQAGGWLDLRQTTPAFKRYWDSVKGRFEPHAQQHHEVQAWQAWLASREDALADVPRGTHP